MFSPSSYLVCTRSKKRPRTAEGSFKAVTVSLRLLSWSKLVSHIKLALKHHSFYFCLQWNGWKGEGRGTIKTQESRKMEKSRTLQ